MQCINNIIGCNIYKHHISFIHNAGSSAASDTIEKKESIKTKMKVSELGESLYFCYLKIINLAVCVFLA